MYESSRKRDKSAVGAYLSEAVELEMTGDR
jgi:hypothetical protein